MIVFKKGVVRIEGEINFGDIVEVYMRGGKFFGKGFVNLNLNIMVRFVIKDKDIEINKELFCERIRKVNEYRKNVFGYDKVYCMVYGEVDYFFGFIVDCFNEIVLI